MNFLIRKFRINLVNYINSVQDIPIEVKRLVLSEILRMVEDKATIICNEEEKSIMEEQKKGLSEPDILTPINAENSDD